MATLEDHHDIRAAIDARQQYARRLRSLRTYVRTMSNEAASTLPMDMRNQLARSLASHATPPRERHLIRRYGRCGTPQARTTTATNLRGFIEYARQRMPTLPCGMSDALGDRIDEAGRIIDALESYD